MVMKNGVLIREITAITDCIVSSVRCYLMYSHYGSNMSIKKFRDTLIIQAVPKSQNKQMGCWCNLLRLATNKFVKDIPQDFPDSFGLLASSLSKIINVQKYTAETVKFLSFFTFDCHEFFVV